MLHVVCTVGSWNAYRLRCGVAMFADLHATLLQKYTSNFLTSNPGFAVLLVFRFIEGSKWDAAGRRDPGLITQTV